MQQAALVEPSMSWSLGFLCMYEESLTEVCNITVQSSSEHWVSFTVVSLHKACAQQLDIKLQEIRVYSTL